MIDDFILTICLDFRSLSEISLPDVQAELSGDIPLQLLQVDAPPGDQGLEHQEQIIQSVQTNDYTIHIVYTNGFRRSMHALGSYITTLPHRFTDTIDVMNKLLARRTKRRFVVLILLAYRGWVHDYGGSMQNLHLKSVERDLVLILDHLAYRHDNRETEWHFLLDFDCEYTDPTGFTRFLPRVYPTKKSILDGSEVRGWFIVSLASIAFVEVNPLSSICSVGGRAEYTSPGTGVTSRHDDLIHYSVTEPQNRSEPHSAFIVAADGNWISGKELYSSLRDKSKKVKASTTTLVLDIRTTTCRTNIPSQSKDDLPVTYAADTATQAPEAPPGRKRPHSQLVAVAASRIGEPGGTLNNHGALTLLLIRYLQRFPSSSAIGVLEHLNTLCQAHPNPSAPPRNALIEAGFRTSLPSDGFKIWNNAEGLVRESRRNDTLIFVHVTGSTTIEY
ncbi:hypothetical protein M407DRAFT_29120 [Tulasnella calospora MUT 4182]|uniref:Uncharacterized protein n=1 Tax=Tulasnella calospora MUT 4182 TaxID=1051891 RepID=A0A0C3Q9H3_9AGAM|nr:hypothetical protein M407DRAFT_29120 [Tulasnella calospora MUT 4182]